MTPMEGVGKLERLEKEHTQLPFNTATHPLFTCLLFLKFHHKNSSLPRREESLTSPAKGEVTLLRHLYLSAYSFSSSIYHESNASHSLLMFTCLFSLSKVSSFSNTKGKKINDPVGKMGYIRRHIPKRETRGPSTFGKMVSLSHNNRIIH